MKRSAIMVLIALTLGIFVPSLSTAAPKAGSSCPSKGKVQTYKGYEFTCLKKSGKLVWSKGVQVKKESSGAAAPAATPEPSVSPKPVSSPTSTPEKTSDKTINPAVDPSIRYFTDMFAPDPDAPEEWRDYQDFIYKNKYQLGPLRYVLKTLDGAKPSYAGKLDRSTSQIDECKPQPTSGYPALGFYSQSDLTRFPFNPHPAPNTVLQVLPVQWKEYQARKSPKQDYGKYFDFLMNWLRNISDNGFSAEIRIPDRYYTLEKGIKEYSGIDVHGKPTEGGAEFMQHAVNAGDPYINFTGVNITLLVVPPETPINYLGNQPWSSNPRSQEGRVGSILTNPPHDLTAWHKNHYLGTPMGWLHEIWHTSRDLGDHGGEGFMGHWGMMANYGMDLMGWEKYVTGFISDSQVICASPKVSSTHWIVPSSYKGAYEKLLVLPVNKNKVVVLESIRSVGYNYKLPMMSQGVLVYIIDTSRTDFHPGEYVVIPKGRINKDYLDAPLKQGETLEVEGYRITILEAGKFGEVIRVEQKG